MKIFISYRRDDSTVTARLLHNELAARFGADQVFMDIGDIGYGDDFARAIDGELADTDVVLVVIGPKWAALIEQRLRGDDWVRHEVAAALRLSAAAAGGRAGRPRILPVLVGGAPWPVAELPPDIEGLQRLSALRVDESSLMAHVNALVEAIQQQTFEEEAADLRAEIRGRRRAQLAAAGVGVAAFLASWIALFDFFGLDTRLAAETMQLAQGGRAAPWSGEVVLVAIDEATERAVGRRFDASWRAEHGRIVELAAAAGARSLAFDLVLEEAGPEAADAVLAAALSAVRGRLPVVFGVQRSDGGRPRAWAPVLADAHWGVACAGLKLGQARTLPLVVQRMSAERVPSLALAAFSGGGAVEAFDGAVVRVRDVARQRSLDLRYFAAESVAAPQPGCEIIRAGDRVASQLLDPQQIPPLRQPPQRLAYERLLQADAATLALLKDRIVLVGVTKQGEDRLPLGSEGEARWGAELLAVQIDGMVRGAAIRPLGGVASWLLTTTLAGVGAATAVALRRRPAAWRWAAVAALMLAFGAAAALWYRVEQQLVGLPYGLAALGLGSWIAGRLIKRNSR